MHIRCYTENSLYPIYLNCYLREAKYVKMLHHVYFICGIEYLISNSLRMDL